ncbi:Mitochondrial amidoxime-reducing component 1, partial [Saguinus oedipus]
AKPPPTHGPGRPVRSGPRRRHLTEEPAMSATGSSALARFVLLAQPRPGWLRVAMLGLAAVALGAVAWRRAWPRRRWRRLQQVGTVAQLWIYPVKSCKGVPVSEAECTALGLRSGNLRDRYGSAPGPGGASSARLQG